MKNEVSLTKQEKEDIIMQSVSRAAYDLYNGGRFCTVSAEAVRAASYAINFAEELLRKKADECKYNDMIATACNNFYIALEWYQEDSINEEVLLDFAGYLEDLLPEDWDAWCNDGTIDSHPTKSERVDVIECMVDVLDGNFPGKWKKEEKQPEKAEKEPEKDEKKPEKNENEAKTEEKPGERKFFVVYTL